MSPPLVAMLTVAPDHATTVVARLRAHAERHAGGREVLLFRAMNRDSDILVVDRAGLLNDHYLWEQLTALGVRCHRVPVEAIDAM